MSRKKKDANPVQLALEAYDRGYLRGVATAIKVLKSLDDTVPETGKLEILRHVAETTVGKRLPRR